ncbi:Uncharacterised protein [uncultured archaeon]|nr:Uncharacterised protein [uncultured archaeon]
MNRAYGKERRRKFASDWESWGQGSNGAEQGVENYEERMMRLLEEYGEAR